MISFHLPQPAGVTLSVYDVKGRLVKALVDGFRSAGPHPVFWKAEHIGSGVYFYKLTVGDESIVRKCLLVK